MLQPNGGQHVNADDIPVHGSPKSYAAVMMMTEVGVTN